MQSHSLTRFAWLSIGAALLTILLKVWAFLQTGSVGLLSDAMESGVNLAGSLMALAMLSVAARPADREHAYGHGKAEYFSSGAEGTLILVAALSIGIAAIRRLLEPQELEELGMGLALSSLASVINLVTGIILLRAGRRHHSVTLEANAHHLFTDVWTSAGVLVGIGLVGITGWQLLDPLVALLVAANIVRTGVGIVRRSILGLMDTSVAPEDLKTIHQVLDRHRSAGLQFHALRTRQAGAWRFVSFHVLVPGSWTVHQGHEVLERIEADLRSALPDVTVFTHLEPADDPCSFDDIELIRPGGKGPPSA